VVEDLHLILNHMTMRILKEEKENENLVHWFWRNYVPLY
jgi:hypothetical protein